MRVLVTGGMGFIGHNVVAQLEDLGHDVTLVDNFTDYGIIPEDELNALMLERQTQISSVCYMYDIVESAVETAFKVVQPELVIHLASFPRQKVVNGNPLIAADSMVKGLLNLCELSCKYKVKKFVYISSSMVYGDFYNDVTEDSVCNPIGQYGIMKYMGERLVEDYSRRGCFDHVIIRPSAVYGPQDVEDRVVSKFMLDAIRNNTLKVNGATEVLDFTYVDDTVQGIVLATTKSRANNKIFNITRSDINLRTLKSAAELAIEITGSGSLEICDRDTAFPRRGRLSIDRARKELGYNPTVTIEQGFRRYYEWILESRFWQEKLNEK